EKLARSTAGRSDTRERPGASEWGVEIRLEQDGDVARRRNGRDVRVGNSECHGLRTLRPAHIDLRGLSVPGGGGQDRLPVRAEARAPDGSLSERQLLERGRRGDALRLAGEIPCCERGERDQRGREKRHAAEAQACSRSRRDSRARRRSTRERLEIERQVMRRV